MHAAPVASLPLVSGTRAPRARLPAAARERVVEAGHPLVREGERRGGAWIVRSGAIVVSVTAESGKRAIVSVLGGGDVAGELCTRAPDSTKSTSDEGRMFLPDVRALVRSRLLFVPADQMLVAPGELEYAEWICRRLEDQSEALARRLASFLTLPVVDRLLSVLEDLASAHGRDATEGRKIELPLTQDDLAAMVGATRESVNRAVQQLSDRGLVRRAGRFYVVRDPPG